MGRKPSGQGNITKQIRITLGSLHDGMSVTVLSLSNYLTCQQNAQLPL